MSWTDERIERLKKLWNDGYTASQVANELGQVTRNAVIGKLHRLGLNNRSKPTTQAAPKAHAPKAASGGHSAGHSSNHGGGVHSGGGGHHVHVMPQARGNLAVAQVAEMEMEPLLYENNVLAFSKRISIMDLREGTCRWPLGDPQQADFCYCGSDSPVGKPYCTDHSRMAYQATGDKRRMA